MTLILNIRGTNGSGKSTLVKSMIPPSVLAAPMAPMVRYPSPTKKDPTRELRSEGYVWNEGLRKIGVAGAYRTACGGMDAMPGFDVSQRSITFLSEQHGCDVILAEGVLASTVYGSWAAYDKFTECSGDQFAYVYMQTPLEVCLERIKQRQRAAGKERPIKEDLVADKVKAIVATRKRAIADRRLVYDLPFGGEQASLLDIMAGKGDSYRVA